MHSPTQSSLILALAAWGRHEALGRHADRVPAGLDLSNDLNSAEFLLQTRSPFVARILARDPVMTLKVQAAPSDIESALLANGRHISQWWESVQASDAKGRGYIEERAASAEKASGELVFAARLIETAPDLNVGRAVLYDGWHRSMAVLLAAQRGLAASTSAFLIVTRYEDPLLPNI